MSKHYPPIGPPIIFGKIIVQLVSFPRQVHRPPPRGEPYYPRKLGYAIERWSEVTPIKDVYAFLSWQLEFEKTVRFLDKEGNIVDEKPNSLWEEKHLQPLLEILEKLTGEKTKRSEETLSPILIETVHTLPMYPSHKAWIRDRMLPEDPDLSVESLSFRLDISLGEAMVILHELRG